ncbi:MAG: hypothetical protein LBT04_10080, partial [Prevotellaceae bacterium]|nr:hypothetical protein [Prevotellaceae bacterium]
MSYAGKPCRIKFTPLQIGRIHNFINITPILQNCVVSTPADLYIKDSPADTGIEPNITTAEHWNSPDIAIVEYNSPGVEVGNLDPTKNYKVRITVRNRSQNASTGLET